MQILQEHGITAQTSPYPLAIADIHGQMRQAKKSEFVNVIKSLSRMHSPHTVPYWTTLQTPYL